MKQSNRRPSHDLSFLSPKEVADELGVTPRTVYNWIYSEEIDATKIGGVWRISATSLRRRMEEEG
ncbi:helix-turn-helix domain-containing protein [Salinibacter pepae]|jgi:excisionase family DNA binding protein|uniref:helix-turn-helix domain-containing protein n=1 Tax=Salinibacter pepae TaxID=3040382 RepID=UPI003C6DEA51